MELVGGSGSASKHTESAPAEPAAAKQPSMPPAHYHSSPHTADNEGDRTPPYSAGPVHIHRDENGDLEGSDATARAMRQFESVDKNVLVRVTTDGTKHEESIPCHCRYNPETDPRSQACGENSDCINRLVQMECNPLTCPCGSHCLNRRFQKRQYAKVRVIDAGRKGFGLQALEDLDTGRFVMEYMGEIVSSGEFRKRARVYQSEGIQHHYFMSIGNNKVIDATRKGCIARFINHSCGPNCVLQKWMVAGAIRMGIFVERPIKRGEEITFDYKFERLAGSEPQLCYCGSPECKGVIGVAKERRKKPAQDAGSGEEVDDDVADIDEEIDDGTVTRRQRDDIRRRHAAVDDGEYDSPGGAYGEDDYSGSSDDGEDDEDEDAGHGLYAARRAAHQRERKNKKGLTSPEQVLKFVQIMHRSSRQTRIIGILIGKLMETSDRRLLKSLIGLQGVGILRAWLQDYEGDDVMLIKILQCVAHLPISTRNTIEESRLNETVAQLCSYSDENVSNLASELVERWKPLKHVFKIPKKSRKGSGNTTPASGTPAVSCRESPSRTNSTPPAASSALGVNSGGKSVHNSPRSSAWQRPVNPSRMRSASPSPRDALSSAPHTAGVNGWGRRSFGYRAQSPMGNLSSRLARSPGRAPYPEIGSRYAARESRSRSPLAYHRTSSYSRFPRSSTSDYPPPGRSYAHPLSASQYSSSGYGTPTSQSRSRYSSWNHAPHRADSDQAYSTKPNEGAAAAHDNPTASLSALSDANTLREQHKQQAAADSRMATLPTTATTKPLALGWKTAYTNDGLVYYYHETTKATQWDPPLAQPEAAQSEAAAAAAAEAQNRNLGFAGESHQHSSNAAANASLPESQAMPPASLDRWLGVGDGRLERGRSAASLSIAAGLSSVAVATDTDVKINGVSKAKVDEIIERTMRRAAQSQGGTAAGDMVPSGMSRSASAGAAATTTAAATMQLVTPDTDGEPTAAATLTQTQSSTSLAGSKTLHRRDSSRSLSVPAAKREKTEKKATAELASYVVRALNKYKGQMDHTEFKREAKKITKILMEKEKKSPAFDPMKLVELSTHKKTKIKQFVTDYMSRLVGRRSSIGSPAAAAAASAATTSATLAGHSNTKTSL